MGMAMAVSVAVVMAVTGIMSVIVIVLCWVVSKTLSDEVLPHVPCKNDMTSTFSPNPTHPMMRTSFGSSMAIQASAHER